jgi:hypothetical protein
MAVVAGAAAGLLYVCGGTALFSVQMEQQHVEAGQARAPPKNSRRRISARNRWGKVVMLVRSIWGQLPARASPSGRPSRQGEPEGAPANDRIDPDRSATYSHEPPAQQEVQPAEFLDSFLHIFPFDTNTGIDDRYPNGVAADESREPRRGLRVPASYAARRRMPGHECPESLPPASSPWRRDAS